MAKCEVLTLLVVKELMSYYSTSCIDKYRYYSVCRQPLVFIRQAYLHLQFLTFLARCVVVFHFTLVMSGMEFC